MSEREAKIAELKRLRQIEELKRLRERGQAPTQIGAIDRRHALAGGLAQGATGLWGDEASAAVSAGAQKLMRAAGAPVGPDKPFSQLYTETRDRLRQGNRAAEAAHPGTYMAGEIAGALGTGGVGASRISALRNMAPMRAGALAGAGGGALAGSGASEGDTAAELRKDTVYGAGLGAGMGAAVPFVAGALRRTTAKGAADAAMRRATYGIDVDQVNKMLRENPDMTVGDMTAMMRRMTAELADEGTSAELLQRKLAAAERIAKKVPQSGLDMRKRGGELMEMAAKRSQGLPPLQQPGKMLTDFQSEFGDSKQFNNAFKRAVDSVVNSGIKPDSKAYAGAIMDRTQQIIGKQATKPNRSPAEKDALNTLRERVTRHAEQRLGPEYAWGRAMWKEGAPAKEAQDELVKMLRSPQGFKYLQQNLQAVPQYRDKVKALFRREGDFDDFMKLMRGEVGMWDTFNRVQKKELARFANIVEDDSAWFDAWKRVGASNMADRITGVDQKLGTAAAVRNLIYETADVVGAKLPAGQMVKSAIGTGSKKAQAEILRQLRSRKLPYPRVLTEPEAAAAVTSSYFGGSLQE